MRNAQILPRCLLVVTALSGAVSGALSGPLSAATALAAEPPPYRLVAAAPGYPGNTAGAQPTMDLLAEQIAAAAGLAPGDVVAEYHPAEQEGIERIAAQGTSLALMPFALFLKYERSLGLRALAQAVGRDGSGLERWSLVAPAGRIARPEDLSGWEIVGVPGYSEPFVRGPLLGGWGALPADARVVFTDRVLGALRRIASGDPIAVLLDAEQSDALSSLPGADAYEIVYTAPPLPVAVVAVVADRLTEEEADRLRGGFLALSEQEARGELFATLRLRGFEPVDTQALEAARTALTGLDRTPAGGGSQAAR